MEYAINKFSTVDELHEKLFDYGDKIYDILTSFDSGYRCFIKMNQEGEIYIFAESQNTGWAYDDYNPEIFSIVCGGDDLKEGIHPYDLLESIIPEWKFNEIKIELANCEY